MELFLNLTWLAVTTLLFALLISSRHGTKRAPGKWTHSHATAWMSCLVLAALLLPAISMTDDLMAMAARADGEQVARRFETSARHHSAVLYCALFAGTSPQTIPQPVRIRLCPRVRSPRLHVFHIVRHSQDRAPPQTI
jgi:hypothetical protein